VTTGSTKGGKAAAPKSQAAPKDELKDDVETKVEEVPKAEAPTEGVKETTADDGEVKDGGNTSDESPEDYDNSLGVEHSSDTGTGFQVPANVDPTAAKVFTGNPDIKDPIVEEGNGYEAQGNNYAEGPKAKVNKARTAIANLNEAKAAYNQAVDDAQELVDRALDDDGVEDVDDLQSFSPEHVE
jgi:hypothetical protein